MTHNENVSIVGLYSAYDGLSRDYLPTYESKNDYTAFRNYENSLLSQEYLKKPDEFRLYKVGEIIRKDDYIVLKDVHSPILVANGLNFVGDTPKEMDQ